MNRIEELSIVSGNGDLAPADLEHFTAYLRKHLSEDLVLDIVEQCLLEENTEYAPIDFSKALERLQKKDGGRYLMLKTLIEGYCTKEGMVMLDPKLVSASYHQRMKELELLKSMGRFRRFFYRLADALAGLLSEKSQTDAIREAIQVTGEVQIARNELAVLELKKSEAKRQADEVLTEASAQSRVILQESHRQAAESSAKTFQGEREALLAEREAARTEAMAHYERMRKGHEDWSELHQRREKLRDEIQKLEQRPAWASHRAAEEVRQKYEALAARVLAERGALSAARGDDYSRSRSASPSPSLSYSASPSPSPSPSASPSWGEYGWDGQDALRL